MNLDTIICGDNATIMATWPAACIDLVVTSPPYDGLRKYGGHGWDFPAVARELSRILKPGGVIVWVVDSQTVDGSETLSAFEQALHFKNVCGLNVWDTMIWHKPNPMPGDGKSRYHQAWEFMFVLTPTRPNAQHLLRDVRATGHGRIDRYCFDRRHDQSNNPMPRKPFVRPEYGFRTNVWTIAKPPAAEDALAVERHPAIFPEALARDHILSWSNPGDVVLDPFAGSGTTLKMAKLNGRRYIGIEINPEYVEICNKRIAQGVLPLWSNTEDPNP
jgi:site-specific DNA-methyltransferase (adenine-specific)